GGGGTVRGEQPHLDIAEARPDVVDRGGVSTVGGGVGGIARAHLFHGQSHGVLRQYASGRDRVQHLGDLLAGDVLVVGGRLRQFGRSRRSARVLPVELQPVRIVPIGDAAAP